MLRSGDQIGPYTLINKLGRGAFGTVWLSEQRTTIATTTAALKIPLDDDVDLETVKHEANLWVRASGHPNVLPIIEANIYDDHVVIASEYAPDGSLESWLKQNDGKAPSVEAAVEIISGILAGLEHLHSRNIIHRDLKPGNILFQGSTPRLADVGISRVLKSTSQSSVIAGTPVYMAPEAFDGKRNEQTDIWSVGVIFYQLLAGRLPFSQEDITSLVGAILSRNPEPLPISIPAPLHEIIGRALAKDPKQRFQSAAEIRAALRNPSAAGRQSHYEPSSVVTVPASPANSIPPVSPPFQSVKQRSSPHLIYGVAELFAVLLVVAGIMWKLSSSPTLTQESLPIKDEQNKQELSPSSSDKNSVPLNSNEQQSASRIRGVWEGGMYQPGNDPFTITMTLNEFKKDEKCGSYEHPTLRCRGTLVGVDVQNGTYILYGRIDYGRDRCLDGLNHLILENEDTLTRLWIRPDTGREGARGTLKKVK